ncbi:MAG: F0F1 ATP synthase subunit A [Clostridia bacterium]|nr:F0F1 ATP synthase subunit A [Clostridia bacterium]
MSVEITGPRILFEIPILGGIRITETIFNGWIVILLVSFLAWFLTRNMVTKNPGKRQLAAEKIYSMLMNLVEGVMGKKWTGFAPYIGALFAYSMFGSLLSLTGLRSVTGDLSTTGAMAILTTIMVIATNIRTNGVFGWLKSYTQPVALITPINIISEIANPVSMAFRHFGNIAAGIVITSLMYAALAAASNLILGWIPVEFIANIPILQVGLPAVLSIYFDLFTGFLQAYIICMLTMVNVSGAGE